MVDKLIDAPLQQECFRYLSIPCEYRGFLPIELPICGLGSSSIGVVVGIVAPSASSASSAASSADKAGSLEEPTRRVFWFVWDRSAGVGKISFPAGCDVPRFDFFHLGSGLRLRGHNRGESRKGSVSD